MSTSNRITPGIAVSLILLLGVLGFLVPQLYLAQETPDSLTVEQNEGEIIRLTSTLEATLISIDNNPSRANVTIVDFETGDIEATGTIDEGTTETITINGETITVTYTEAIGPNTGIIQYEYPLYYGWPSGVKLLLQFLSGFTAIIIGFFSWYLIRGDSY